jgi:hypothetical protein
LATPRHDGKLSIHLKDLDNFHHEWDVESLPWDAVTPITPGDEHPEALDQRLVDALNARALNSDMHTPARGATLAFLYLYMILSRHQDQ